jgi:predicted nucleic acid-binding protein
VQQSLRRLKPEKHRKRLVARDRGELPFVSELAPPFPKLLLDTTVYIDALQGRLPGDVEVLLRAGSLWHCTITEAELAAIFGLLDPAHPDTQSAVLKVAGSIEQRPAHRTLSPDAEIWREAGMLAGLLARLQGFGKGEQRKVLNDALIFLTAAKYGCTALTRNFSDFDLLMQVEGRGAAVFYETR